MNPLPAQQKLDLIKRAQSGEKVARLCRETGIARKTFYQWLKKTSGARPQQQLLLLSDKRIKQLPSPRPLNSQDRFLIINKVVNKENSVSALCREAGISRRTFYKWMGRFNEVEKPSVDLLKDRRPAGENHWRFLGPEKERVILNYVTQNPQHSCRKIATAIPQISYHGIQNVLERHNLNTYQRRLTYQQSLYPTATPVFVPPVAPTVFGPAKILRFLASPFETIPKLAFSSKTPKTFLSVFLLSFLLFGVFFQFSKLLSKAPPGTQAGLIFATFSLTFGLFFFIYSLKYYFTLVLILGFSRQVSGGNGNQELGIRNQGENRKRSILERLFGVALNGNGQKNGNGNGYGYGQGGVRGGLQPDLSQVKLERHPFVSIHLPLYNEKRVVERLLTAVTSQDYPSTDSTGLPQASSGQVNYEIVVVDDSTDETTEIAQSFAKRWNQTKPYIKVIHRETREGYKGGALQVALENTDPRAEFVLVFDADFLPYPDTITQFLKYFQVTAGGLDFSSSSSWRETRLAGRPIGSPGDSIASLQNDTKESPIAAIQGYQWHVLNKSENWITRGVRSEYAGSYVVERSGEEALGALKQIAGSVYMVRRDVLDKYGWGTSLTEDFELTLKLYRDGYKVVYTPYIQAPSECVSTLKRLIRQRMRWAEGHSHNIKRMFGELMWGRWEYQETQTVEDGGLKIGLEDRRLKMENQPSTIHLQTPPSTFHHLSSKTWVPSKLTFMEKLEFLYLSPYYLQATFFMVGTLSWFISEAVFHTKLPFWTSVWGWSLVFTNLFSLPLMNLVGLFLEESEERDYGGILSFIFLTYILTPFQGYAALKGFLEKQEGPWFRTPKTGKITDIFTPGRFYRFIWGIFGGRPATAPIAADISADQHRFSSNPYVALATANTSARLSAFSSFQNFNLRPWRIRWAGKSVLAAFLITIILLNYLTFFVPSTEASSRLSAGKIEQQINIIDQIDNTTFSTTSTTDTPTDNSLGLVHWTAGSYTGATVYFEAIICNSGYDGGKGVGWQNDTTTATLYTSGGSSVSGSAVSVYQGGCSYSRQRSGSITLADGTDYTVRYKTGSAGTAYLKATRLIIVQLVDSSTWLSNTETQVEVGQNGTTTSTSYVLPYGNGGPLYCYDTTATGTTCTSASPSVWNPTPTIKFEATLSNNTAGQTAYAALYSGSSCATQVSGSEVSVTGTTWTLVRSSAITLSAGTEYYSCIKAGANTARIANAKIILTQSDANGIRALETVQHYNNSYFGQGPSWASSGWVNYYDPGNFSGGTFTKYFESSFHLNDGVSDGSMRLYNATGSTAITGSTVTDSMPSDHDRRRSGDITSNMPTTAATMDAQGNNIDDYSAWLIIQVSSLQIPEKLLLLIPVILFLPKFVRWWRSRKKAKLVLAQFEQVKLSSTYACNKPQIRRRGVLTNRSP